MIGFTQGNLLEADVEALVNAVNTRGIMGKGIALMFKKRFPGNFRACARACEQGEVRIGKMFVTRRDDIPGPKWIVNFPTKTHWRVKTRTEWIDAGLADLVEVVRDLGIRSIAIPALGCGNGGLDWRDVRPRVEAALASLDGVDAVIYEPAPKCRDVARIHGAERLNPARGLARPVPPRDTARGSGGGVMASMAGAAVARAAGAGLGVAEPCVRDIERIAPQIRAGAGEAERARRLPAATLDALHGAALFRMLLPRRFGGVEMPLPRYMPVMEAMAKIDGSAAWCLGQANGCAMTAGFVDPAVAEDIWGNPRAVLAWGPGKGRAIPENGGFRLSGRWSFASGMRHATWLGGMAAMPGDDDPRRQRTLLFPAGRAETEEIWDVLGLLGTGSDAFSVDGLHVREAYVYDRDNPATRREEGTLYLFPLNALYATGFSATALGLARAMLDDFIALAGEKTPRLALRRLADDGAVQFEIGECQARLGAARAFLRHELEAAWAAAEAEHRVTLENRMRIRLATTFAIREAKAVGDAAFDASGATAIFASNAVQRRFRDLHSVAQQLQGRKAHIQNVGAWLAGREPDLASA